MRPRGEKAMLDQGKPPPCFATSYAMERIAGGWLLKYKSGHCG